MMSKSKYNLKGNDSIEVSTSAIHMKKPRTRKRRVKHLEKGERQESCFDSFLDVDTIHLLYLIPSL